MAGRTFYSRYGGAFLFLAGAVALRAALDPLLGDRLPLSTIYAALVFAVLWGGTGPGIAVAVFGYVAGDFFFMHPRGHLSLGAGDVVVIVTHAITSAVMIFIGHRLQHERSLRVSDRERALQAQLRVMQSLPMLVAALDARGVIVFWNAEAERVTGYRAEEVVGNERAMDMLYPDAAYRQAMFDEWSRRGEAYRDWAWEIRCKDGSSRKIAWSSLGGAPPVEGWTRWGVGEDVTAREDLQAQVQRQLREVAAAEVQARLALEAAQLGRYTWLPPEEVVMDARCREIAGVPPHVPLNLAAVNAHIHPDDLPRVQAARRKALDPAGAGTFIAEYRLMRDDGGVRWVSSRGQVQWEGEGAARKAAAMHGTVLDITARVREEERLRAAGESQRLLVAVHDAARAAGLPDAVLWEVVQLTGRHFAVSRCTYGEIDAEEEHVIVARDYVNGVASIPGAHRMDAFGPDLIAELKQGRTAAIADVRLDERTAANAAAYEAIETRSLLCVPLVKEGRFSALLVLHHRQARAWTEEDMLLLEQVAERTWFVLETARAQVALRESRDVLALAMQGSRMGAWSRDMVTNRVWWAPELERLFGLTPGGFAGDHPSFNQLVHPEDLPALRAAVDQAVRMREDYAIEFRFRHASGEWRWMEGRGKAIYNAEGVPAMLYGLGMDITERKAAEAALREADRRKDEFLATLAHELRNPLAPIRNAVELLRLQHGGDEGLQRLRAIIERQVRQLTRLVDDLLEVSRITRGVIPLRRAPMELAEAVNAALETVKPQMQESRHSLEVRMPRERIVLDADQARVTQVLQNLLHNAARYTPPGGRIALDVAEEPNRVRISVRDNGIGIPLEQQAHVFDMFTRGSAASERNQDGLGIGLALVKGIVEMHAGQVEARSEGAGRGAEFVVWLPRS